MLEQINQAAFAVILVIIVYTILRILFPENDPENDPENNQDTIIDHESVTSPDTEQKIKILEYVLWLVGIRLRHL